MNVETTTLTGTRSQLIPLQATHARELFDISRNPEIWAYMPVKVQTLDEMDGLVKHALEAQARGLELPFAVIDRTTDQIVGTTRYLNISEANRQLEIGWTWYHPSVWRTRVNTECKYLLLHHAFSKLNVVRVQFCADKRNERSHNAILRLGATHEGTLRRHRVLSDGYIRDTCVYSILDSEWQSVESRLQEFLQRS